MSKNEIRGLLIQIFQDQFARVDTDNGLMNQIDRIGMVSLIVLLEEKFSIDINAAEVNERNFSSLDSVINWIFIKLEKNANRQP